MESPKKTNDGALQLLQQKLQNAGINTSKWGTGQAKTLAHLQKEIESGETMLVTKENGEILRRVVVGGADIYYISPDAKTYRLKEEKQIFKDGRERRRDLGNAVSEKMKLDENPKDAMVRGIAEELGVEGEIALEETGTDIHLIDSPSYPTLQSEYVTYKYRVILKDQQFNPDGYIENQSDKSTYFIWEEVKSGI